MSKMMAQLYVERLLEIENFFSEEADEILEKLIEIGEPAIKPMIEDYLGCEDIFYGEEYTIKVADALGQIGQNAIKALIATLDNDNMFLASNVARTLGQLGNIEAIEPLKRAIYRDKSIAAMYGLAQIGGNEVAQILLDLLESNTLPRQSIMGWLGVTSSELVFDALVYALKDSDAEIRRSAVWSIRDTNHPNAAQLLLPLLDDTDGAVSYSAALVLVSQFQDARVAPYFAQYLTHEHAHLRSTAISSLGQIGAKQYETDLYQIMVTDKDKYVRLDCAVALLALQASNIGKAEQLILESITHRQGYIRFRTLQSLSNLSSPLAIRWLLLGLKDKDAFNRYYTVTLIGKLEIAQILAPLRKSLKIEKHRIVKKEIQATISKLER